MSEIGRRLPLSFYVEKIERGEQFASLLFGDGEFRVMMGGEQSGQPFTHYREVITRHLEVEMAAALRFKQDGILRGTDLNLINWRTYAGGDRASFIEVGARIERYLGGRVLDWVDGTVWETAVSQGELGPFLRCLKGKRIALTSNKTIGDLELWQQLNPLEFRRLTVADENASASAELYRLEMELRRVPSNFIHIVCMGLGAIPLIVRMRKVFPDTTFLDLGSTFDVFAGIGAERGWRGELYKNLDEHLRLIAKNMEGVI